MTWLLMKCDNNSKLITCTSVTAVLTNSKLITYMSVTVMCLYRFVTDSTTHAIDRQFLWGPAFLISPVVQQV